MDRIHSLQSEPLAHVPRAVQTKAIKSGFDQLVAAKVEQNQSVKVSKHAEKRLQLRDLQLGSNDYHEISQAMDDLATKGSRESLLIYKDMGLIANIHNRTIITAMDMNELSTVTNIDSAKFIK